ncbi:hypothetical protein [Domibacillus mangrovi]|uniref:Uncharacterized protein n=1 Tax=Domibacillus mangrovi TaxID=1714354 RepID=A0A1Q5P613_9BACI|nr:hypothetical protein [Domibacillus mangrovi]OKL37608.1 hypothetical protein BLL40_04700 [Domibacillus mangrovi]
MGKINLIEPNSYFVESKKAIHIALDKEKSLLAEMPKQNKLDLLRKRKKDTNSVEEYEKIEELEKQLEKEIKFRKPIPLVPAEYKETIQRNVEIEAAELNKQLTELRKELKKQLPYLQDVLLPLLVNVHELKKMRNIPNNINAILDFEFLEEGNFVSANYLVRKINNNEKNKLVEDLKEIISAIESASV